MKDSASIRLNQYEKKLFHSIASMLSFAPVLDAHLTAFAQTISMRYTDFNVDQLSSKSDCRESSVPCADAYEEFIFDFEVPRGVPCSDSDSIAAEVHRLLRERDEYRRFVDENQVNRIGVGVEVFASRVGLAAVIMANVSDEQIRENIQCIIDGGFRVSSNTNDLLNVINNFRVTCNLEPFILDRNLCMKAEALYILRNSKPAGLNKSLRQYKYMLLPINPQDNEETLQQMFSNDVFLEMCFALQKKINFYAEESEILIVCDSNNKELMDDYVIFNVPMSDMEESDDYNNTDSDTFDSNAKSDYSEDSDFSFGDLIEKNEQNRALCQLTEQNEGDDDDAFSLSDDEPMLPLKPHLTLPTIGTMKLNQTKQCSIDDLDFLDDDDD